jgi:hypothetical protein
LAGEVLLLKTHANIGDVDLPRLTVRTYPKRMLQMMVYVISKDGKVLMPTRPSKAKKLLKQGKAIVKRVRPFTIQLTYETTTYTQSVTLGMDSGYSHIGFSAISGKKELICGEVKLLQGMKERLTDRSMYRRQRRSRTRYRAPRFDNRTSSKKKRWLAPSIQHKLDSHIRFLEKMKQILPVSKTVIEVASFDIQKIKNPSIQGEEYQQGEQLGFWNVREYVLHRDGHTCQNPDCKNKDKSPILEIHHIIYKDNGGTDAPSNLITLCTKCHTSSNHKPGKFLYEWQKNKPKLKSFKEATFMSTVRWRLVDMKKVTPTYGYITKNQRIQMGLEKTHYNDAFIIAGGTSQSRFHPIEYKQVKRNNRSLEKFFDAKVIDIRTGEKVSGATLDCGRRTRNQEKRGENLRAYRGQKFSKGQRRIRTQRYFYQPNDLVKFAGEIVKVVGTFNKGKNIKLENKKNPPPHQMTPYKFCKGMVVISWIMFQRIIESFC